MQEQTLSISLPPSLVEFIDSYKAARGGQSPSQVIEEALTLLQERELEESYRQASAELDADWDVVLADGLTDETW